MLSGKVIVVIGAAGRLGRAFTSKIAKHGGTVIAADVDFHAAQALSDEANSDTGTRTIPARIDICDRDSIQCVINQACAEYGKIDAVVNSAYPRGPGYGRKLEDVELKDFCHTVNLHLGGFFLASQQFALHFSRQGRGNIINIASIYGVIAPKFGIYEGTPMTTPVEYTAIKAGIIHLTRYFAQYYKSASVRANSISPGGILDNQPASFVKAYKAHTGSKGMLHADDVAGALLFLLSDHSLHVTGQNLIVDDGFTI